MKKGKMRCSIYLINFLMLCCFWCGTVSSQMLVKGRVLDLETNEPLPFVNVYVDGAFRGTCTDMNGSFSIGLNGRDSVLVFSMMGYVSQNVNIGRAFHYNDEIIVKLEPLISSLTDVVVYSTSSDAEGVIKKVFQNIESNYNTAPYEMNYLIKERKEEDQKICCTYQARIEAFYKGYGKLYTSSDTLKYKCLSLEREKDRSSVHLFEKEEKLCSWVKCDFLYRYSWKALKESYRFKYVDITSQDYVIEVVQCKDTIQGPKKDIYHKRYFWLTIDKNTFAVKTVKGWIFARVDAAKMNEEYTMDYKLYGQKYCMDKLEYKTVKYTQWKGKSPVITYEYIRVDAY